MVGAAMPMLSQPSGEERERQGWPGDRSPGKRFSRAILAFFSVHVGKKWLALGRRARARRGPPIRVGLAFRNWAVETRQDSGV